jgi:hypothetical protein
LKSTADSYGKKRKYDELFKDEIQEKVQNILQAEREKMHESFQEHIQEQVREHVQAQLQRLLAEQGNVLVLHNPGGHHSNCASATAIENDDNRYPIDDLEESKECRLVTPVLGIPRTVEYGLVRPLVEGTLFNSHPIPKGYAIVHMDRVKPGHRRSKLEYLERMVNGNLEGMLVVTSYGASGTLSLIRKTLNLPVQIHHRHRSNLCHRHHHSSNLCHHHHRSSNLCHRHHNSIQLHHHHHQSQLHRRRHQR